MRPQLRIRHVINGLGTGGAETMLLKLVGGSSRHCHSVVSLAGAGDLGYQFEEMGVPLQTLDLHRPSHIAPSLLALSRIMRSGDADVTLAWLDHSFMLTSLAHRLHNIATPLIWTVRRSLGELDGEKWRTRTIIKANARLSRIPRRIIYNSFVGARDHEAIGFDASKREVVPNGFDLSRYSPSMPARLDMRRSLGIAEDEIVFGLVARLHWMKNHAGFFDAAARVLNVYPRARFVLVGLGTEKGNPELRSLISDDRVLERAILLGRRSDIPAVTRAFDVACNVSLTEGFANTIGEAMASGVPCLVTDTGDSALIVGSTGVICRDTMGAAIAEGMMTMAGYGREALTAMGEEARRHIASTYSLDRIVARYDDIFDDVIGLAR